MIGCICQAPLALPRAILDLPEAVSPVVAGLAKPVPSCLAGRDLLTSWDCLTDPGRILRSGCVTTRDTDGGPEIPASVPDPTTPMEMVGKCPAIVGTELSIQTMRVSSLTA